jgi:PAT family beta-lactamase induction signal transducer AmpG
VAIDGMAVDLVPPAERARANGFMFGGQSIGIWAGTAGTGILLALFGLPVAITMNAVVVGSILALLVVFRERPGEKILPWTAGGACSENLARLATAWKPLLTTTFRELLRADSLKLIFGLFMLGVIYGTYLGVQPLVATGPGGWTDAGFSSLNGTGNLLAGILGVLLLGRIADRVTPRRSAMAAAIGMATLSAAFVAAMAYWSSEALIVSFVLTHQSLYLLAQISLCSIAMGRCNPAVSATQFTLYMAMSNMGISASAAFLGVLDALGGLRAMYVAIVLAGTLIFLAGMVFKSAYARGGHA